MSHVPCPNVPFLLSTRKIASKHIDFGDLICKDDEIFVPLQCQRKKAKFAA